MTTITMGGYSTVDWKKELLNEKPLSKFDGFDRDNFIIDTGSIRKRREHECIQVLCECGSLLERLLRHWECVGCGHRE